MDCWNPEHHPKGVAALTQVSAMQFIYAIKLCQSWEKNVD